MLNNEDIDETSDDYSLGLHLVHEHGCTDREDFNKHLQVQIIENCSPSSLEKKEHLYISLRLYTLLVSTKTTLF